MKKEDEDFFTYAGIVNRECEKFKFEELSPDRFKSHFCLRVNFKQIHRFGFLQEWNRIQS